MPRLGETWQHYKRGCRYKIIGVCKHSETNKLMVAYVRADVPFGPDVMFEVRPLSIFMEPIDPSCYRFTKVEDSP